MDNLIKELAEAVERNLGTDLQTWKMRNGSMETYIRTDEHESVLFYLNEGSKFLEGIELEGSLTDKTLARAATGQCLIDSALKGISTKLVDLFMDKYPVEKHINKDITRAESCFSLKEISEAITSETQLESQIEFLKKEFSLILERAKQFSFKVLERKEWQYHIYQALKIDTVEVWRYFKSIY